MSGPFDDAPSDCPLCGAAHSTCAPEGWVPPADDSIFPPPVRPERHPGQTVLVPRDIFHDIPTSYPGQTMTVLWHAKSTRITPEEARECGLLPVESDVGPALEHKAAS